MPIWGVLECQEEGRKWGHHPATPSIPRSHRSRPFRGAKGAFVACVCPLRLDSLTASPFCYAKREGTLDMNQTAGATW